MTIDTVMVLTNEPLEAILAKGGSGDWKANKDRVRRCRWIVTVRNRHSDWSEGREEHGAAFAIGRISGVRHAPEAGRLLIEFDRYALLDKASVWPTGARNPVGYANLESLGVEPDGLEWREAPHVSRAEAGARATSKAERQVPSEVFARAKLMIAESLRVAPSAVRISIQI